MFKKLCVAFLSLCIAVAMVLGVSSACSGSNVQDTVTMCILEAKEELY